MRYFVWGYYGWGNFGDQAMLAVIVKRIASVRPGSMIYVKCANSVTFRKDILHYIVPIEADRILLERGNKVLKWLRYLWSVLAVVCKADVLLVGGGGLFLDKGRQNNSLFALALCACAARMLGKKVHSIGVGIDTLRCRSSRLYLKVLLSMSETVCIRERYGYEIACASLGEAKEKVRLSADILYAREVVDFLRQGFQSGPKESIGISLMDYYLRYEPSGERRERFIGEFSRFAQAAVSKGQALTFLVFQDKIGDRDNEITAEVIRRAHLSPRDYSLESLTTLPAALLSYNNIRFMLGMRYHSLVISGILGIPFAGVIHERKIEDVCNELDMPGIPVDELSVERLTEIVFNAAEPQKMPVIPDGLIERCELNFRFLEEASPGARQRYQTDTYRWLRKK